MNSLGLNLILRLGCLCTKEKIELKGRKFIILDLLGEGGFSTVQLLEDVHSREKYALKRIKCHSAEDQRIAMMEVEYHRILATSDRILPLIDYDLRKREDPFGGLAISMTGTGSGGRSDQHHHHHQMSQQNSSPSEVLLLLPYHPRGTLALHLEMREKSSRNFLPEVEVLRHFLGICEGVEVLHTATPATLAHRDLKAGNILLDEKSGSPILMDLGSVAKARVEISDASQARKLEEIAAERSSMTYRAPELFNIPSLANIDERTDIWSLGCLLFALCFFKSPFDIIYERGDSVPLAVVSGRIEIPQDSPYSNEIHDFIKWILKVPADERPFIQDLISKSKQLLAKSQGCL